MAAGTQARIAMTAIFCLLPIAVQAQTEGSKAPRFQPAQVVATVDPVYPPNSVNPGTVVLNVTVGASGKIQDIELVRADPGFNEEAIRAVKHGNFSPRGSTESRCSPP